MRIPKRVKIKGVSYKIVLVQQDGEFPISGLMDPVGKKIFIVNDSDKTVLEKIFLHEICHALFFELGLQQTSFNEDLEEIICENVSDLFLKLFSMTLRG